MWFVWRCGTVVVLLCQWVSQLQFRLPPSVDCPASLGMYAAAIDQASQGHMSWCSEYFFHSGISPDKILQEMYACAHLSCNDSAAIASIRPQVSLLLPSSQGIRLLLLHPSQATTGWKGNTLMQGCLQKKTKQMKWNQIASISWVSLFSSRCLIVHIESFLVLLWFFHYQSQCLSFTSDYLHLTVELFLHC